jgi:hypothetical protein
MRTIRGQNPGKEPEMASDPLGKCCVCSGC